MFLFEYEDMMLVNIIYDIYHFVCLRIILLYFFIYVPVFTNTIISKQIANRTAITMRNNLSNGSKCFFISLNPIFHLRKLVYCIPFLMSH